MQITDILAQMVGLQDVFSGVDPIVSAVSVEAWIQLNYRPYYDEEEGT